MVIDKLLCQCLCRVARVTRICLVLFLEVEKNSAKAFPKLLLNVMDSIRYAHSSHSLR